MIILKMSTICFWVFGFFFQSFGLSIYCFFFLNKACIYSLRHMLCASVRTPAGEGMVFYNNGQFL